MAQGRKETLSTRKGAPFVRRKTSTQRRILTEDRDTSKRPPELQIC